MNTTHDASREREIFLQAIEFESVEARRDYLAKACEGRPDRLARIEALLKSHEEATRFLEETPPGSAEPLGERPGMRIGRYKLLEQIGEGGCGVVFMAEQEEPVRRRVALKVIKIGMDTRAIVARFEAERQALAMMDHPSIAKVFDAGATELGRPYFVMELVRGVPLTRFCDEHQLDLRQRLELFVQVCQAVQHAHQKGVIHRDLKPSNVLVTMHDDRPVPKVIDFGIAKATEGRLTDRTHFTFFDQFVGTPAYMSPEQAGRSDLDVDTRSDIYTLGVLLYELLTGVTPFDAQELMAIGWEAMRQAIREKDPIKPSTRLTQLQSDKAGPTRESRTRAAAVLATDLDWIVMKCLEKDRTRRYETANGLAADLQRHLANEAVIARPPSLGYQLQKAIRRHRVAFGAGALVTLSLVVGLTLAGWMYLKQRRALEKEAAALVEARQERDRADGAARESEVARNQASQEKRQAEANLARVREAEGWRKVREGDYFGALGAFADALRLEKDDPDRAALHRQRLASTYARCPRLVNVWSTGSNMTWVAFSSDGSRLLSANTLSPTQAVARIRDASTGRDLVAPMEHRGPIATAYWSRDESRVVTASLDGTARVWDAMTGQPVSPPLIHQGPVSYANIDSKGKAVVAWSARESLGGYVSQMLTVWDIEPSQLRWERIQTGEMLDDSYLFLNDDKEIVSATRTLDAKTGDDDQLHPLASRMTVFGGGTSFGTTDFDPVPSNLPRSDPKRLVYSPSGNRLFVSPLNKYPSLSLLIDVTNQFCILKRWRGLEEGMRGVFNGQGEYLATIGENGRVQFWRTQSGESLDWSPKTGPTIDGQCTSMAFSADGFSFAVGASDGTVRGFCGVPMLFQSDIETLPPLPHQSPVIGVAIAGDARWVRAACLDGTVTEWNLNSDDVPKHSIRYSTTWPSIKVDSSGQYLVGDSYCEIDNYMGVNLEMSRLIPIWNLNDGTRLNLWPSVCSNRMLGSFEVLDRNAVIRSINLEVESIDYKKCTRIAFSIADSDLSQGVSRLGLNSSNLIACGYNGGTETRIYEISSGRVLHRIVTETRTDDAVLSIDWSKLITIERNRQVSIWDPRKETRLAQWFIDSADVRAVAFSADSTRVLLQRLDNPVVELWESATARRLFGPLTVPWMAVDEEHRELSPDLVAYFMVVEGKSVLGRLFDPSAMRELDHRGVVAWAFTPDSCLLVTGSEDGEIRFWDSRSGSEAQLPLKVPVPPRRILFTPDGRKLVVEVQGGVFVWDFIKSERSNTEWLELASFHSGERIVKVGRIESDVEEMSQAWRRLMPVLGSVSFGSPGVRRSRLQYEAWMAEERDDWGTAFERLSELVNWDPSNLEMRERRATAAVRSVHSMYEGSREVVENRRRLELALVDWDSFAFHLKFFPEDRLSVERALSRARSRPLALLGRREEAERCLLEGLGIAPLPPQHDSRRIDLGPWFTHGIRVHDDSDAILESSEGLQFDFRGAILLAGGWSDEPSEFRAVIRGIPIQQRFRRAHLLIGGTGGTLGQRFRDRTLVGKLVFQYADGLTNSLDLRIGDDLRQPFREGEGTSETRFSKSVFSWPVDAKEEKPYIAHLYHRPWDNPRPHVEVVSVDFVSAMNAVLPSLYAITVEPTSP